MTGSARRSIADRRCSSGMTGVAFIPRRSATGPSRHPNADHTGAAARPDRKEAQMAATLPREPHAAPPPDAPDRTGLHPSEIPGPPLASWLFKDTRAAWLWLPLRLYLGWSWVQHGYQKVTNPAWTDSG